MPSVTSHSLDSSRLPALHGTPPAHAFRLSKSKIIAGRQCLKRLWLQVHRPEAADDSASQVAFANGYAVGDLAHALHPGGILVGDYRDPAGSLARTQALLAAPADVTLFEATFQADNVRVMADVVEQGGGLLHLIEVKSSTRVKPYQCDDVAVQAHVMARSGHCPDRVFLRVINSDFVYRGGGDYRGLFRDEDVTAQVLPRGEEVSRWIAEQQQMLAGAEPAIGMGSQCNSPYPCEFASHCRASCARGAEVPASASASASAACAATEASTPATEFSQPAPLPRYHLALACVALAVPHWAGTRPYQGVPFLWALRAATAGGGEETRTFLHTGDDAPLRPVIESLLAAVVEPGEIAVDQRAPLQRLLRSAARAMPDRSAALQALEGRLVEVQTAARVAANAGEMQLAYMELVAPATTPARRALCMERLIRAAERALP